MDNISSETGISLTLQTVLVLPTISLYTPSIVPLVMLLLMQIDLFETSISCHLRASSSARLAPVAKYKEKITPKGKAVFYMRYLDNFRFFPLLRVYDAEDKVILEKNLPETTTFDNFGQISLTSKKVTIKPRKNSREDFYEPIVFELL